MEKRKREEVPVERKRLRISQISEITIQTLTDLIQLGEIYEDAVHDEELTKHVEELFPRLSFYDRLYDILPDLRDLQNLVGMEKCKQMVLLQVLYFLQELHDFESGDMMHVALCGPPGSGKTTLGRILGNIFRKLGYLRKRTFRIVTRSDLIGQYVGETTKKTTKVLEDCIGGCCFIDEVYSLGNKEDGRSDQFGREAVNLIMQFCSDHKREFMCIIAGYEKQVNEQFFALNPGADRRFPWKIIIEPYQPKELREIFLRFIEQSNEWRLDVDALSTQIFEEKELFANNGGDVETFFFYCRLSHSRHLATNERKIRFYLNREDIEAGLQLLRERKKKNKREEKEEISPHILHTMYS